MNEHLRQAVEILSRPQLEAADLEITQAETYQAIAHALVAIAEALSTRDGALPLPY